MKSTMEFFGPGISDHQCGRCGKWTNEFAEIRTGEHIETACLDCYEKVEDDYDWG